MIIILVGSQVLWLELGMSDTKTQLLCMKTLEWQFLELLKCFKGTNSINLEVSFSNS